MTGLDLLKLNYAPQAGLNLILLLKKMILFYKGLLMQMEELDMES